MAGTFLFIWNPNRWVWDDFSNYANGLENRITWSCGNTKKIRKGDRIFMMRVGVEPKGIFASGEALSDTYEDEHWADKSKKCNYVDIKLDKPIDPDNNDILTKDRLIEMVSDKYLGTKPPQTWTAQASGLEIPPDIAVKLEKVWREFSPDSSETEDIGYSDDDYSEGEGKKTERLINYYERKPKLRKKAIECHGTKCVVCGFDFGDRYGDRGEGFIEVHHLRPVSSLGEEEKINPKTDMTVLCPNCHRMIHRDRNNILTVDGLKRMYKAPFI